MSVWVEGGGWKERERERYGWMGKQRDIHERHREREQGQAKGWKKTVTSI